MKSLEIVHLSNCIEEGQDGLAELVDALLTNKDTLKYVDISKNNWNKNPAAIKSLLSLIIKGTEV